MYIESYNPYQIYHSDTLDTNDYSLSELTNDDILSIKRLKIPQRNFYRY